MNQFEDYASYYDTLYKEKNYTEEMECILRLFQLHANPQPRSLLSLGCGTCSHELLLAKKGFCIEGVDLSEQMLQRAQEKIDIERVAITLHLGDVRTIELHTQFDAVLSLFNVAGYQRTQPEFEQFTDTAAKHLKPNGIFIFDAWYQPAVLTDPPSDRIKTIRTGEDRELVRATTQKIDVEQSLLNITFQLTERQGDKILKTFSEHHPMRFFTLHEIDAALEHSGLTRIQAFADLDPTRPVSRSHWNMMIVARRI